MKTGGVLIWYSLVLVAAAGLSTCSAPREFHQRCEMCGAEFIVEPTQPGKRIPPTVEWCFFDGAYCEEGVRLAITAQDATVMARLIEHCRECKGCRCAAFEPEEWRKIIGE